MFNKLLIIIFIFSVGCASMDFREPTKEERSRYHKNYLQHKIEMNMQEDRKW